MSEMIDCIFSYCDAIKNDRTPDSVFAYTMSEIGELADEHMIRNGMLNKPVGFDGVPGEVADCIICLIHLLHLHHPELTAEEFEGIVINKLRKWHSKATLDAKRTHG